MGQLTRLDEWPRHQTMATFDLVSDTSPHWSDGYYFVTGDDRGEVTWFAGFRLYANNDVLDAFVCASRDGRQHNMRWSRRLRPRIDDLDCGPMSVEILEGLRTLRTRAEPNRYGLACDLTWTGDCPPYLEDRVQVVINGRLHADRANYSQCSTVTGWVELGGHRVEASGWTGVRDHSWGIGNQTGGPRSAAIAPPPATPAPRGLRQWCVFRMPDRSLFWQFHHSAAGEYTMFEGQCVYRYGDARPAHGYEAIDHDVRWEAVAGRPVRRMREGTVELTRLDGHRERYRIEAISAPVYLQGGGYHSGFDDGLGRGVYRGEQHDEGEEWELTGPTTLREPKGIALNRYAYAEQWARCTNLERPDDTGVGHLECVVLGPYPGFDE